MGAGSPAAKFSAPRGLHGALRVLYGAPGGGTEADRGPARAGTLHGPGSWRRPRPPGRGRQAAAGPSASLKEQTRLPRGATPGARSGRGPSGTRTCVYECGGPSGSRDYKFQGAQRRAWVFLAARSAGLGQVAAGWHASPGSGINKGATLSSTVIRVQVGGELSRAARSCLCRAECPAAWHSCAWRGSYSAPRAPGPAPRRVPGEPAAVRAAPRRPWAPTAPARRAQRELGLGRQRRWGGEVGCAPGPPWPWRRRWT